MPHDVNIADCVSKYKNNSWYMRNTYRCSLKKQWYAVLSWFRYRILAFDHDLLSFTDLRFEDWPAVLITNPKNAQYLQPGVEPLSRIRSSTHIRCLCVCPLEPSSACETLSSLIRTWRSFLYPACLSCSVLPRMSHSEVALIAECALCVGFVGFWPSLNLQSQLCTWAWMEFHWGKRLAQGVLYTCYNGIQRYTLLDCTLLELKWR